MPEFYQEPEPLELRALIGGLNDTDSINDIQDIEATLAHNVTFDDHTIGNRRGRVRDGDQIDPSGTAGVGDRVAWWKFQFRKRDGTTQDLQVNGTHLYKQTAGLWLGAISGLNPGDATDIIGGGVRRGTHVQYNDILYYCDGTLQKRYNGSNIRDWSFAGGTLPAPSIDAVTGSAGNLGAGNYQIVYSYRDPLTGDETNPSTASAAVAVAANTERKVTIPANASWTPQYTRVRLYRTVVNGAGAFFFERELDIGSHNLATTAYTWAIDAACRITIADSSLGAEVEFDNDPIPTGISVVFVHDERVIAIDHTRATVYWSKKGRPWSFPTANAQDLLKEDGHPAIGGFVMFGFPYVWKRGGPGFQLGPHPTLGYVPQQLPARHGCESHWSIVVDENHAYWADKDGFLRFNGQQTENISDAKIRRTFATLAKSSNAYISNSVGIHHNQADRQRVSWFFSTADATKDKVINLDLRTHEATGQGGPNGSGWHVEEYSTYGQRVCCHYEDSSNRTNHVYTADANGYAYRLRTNTSGNEVYSDEGSPILMKWHSKWYGNGLLDQLLHWLDVEFERSAPGRTAGLVTVKVWADADERHPVVTRQFNLYDSGNLTRTLRFNMPGKYFRRFRIGFEHQSANGDVSIVKVVPWGSTIGTMMQAM